ncbi:MAG: hypothetical protein MI923_01795 [Phycisphaerales bacterium]|nr:hypothetical protein [Phycisphaerales bacterium]
MEAAKEPLRRNVDKPLGRLRARGLDGHVGHSIIPKVYSSLKFRCASRTHGGHRSESGCSACLHRDLTEWINKGYTGRRRGKYLLATGKMA